MELSSFISGFENLPKDIQRQLVEYAEFLLAKYQTDKKTKKKVKNSHFHGKTD